MVLETAAITALVTAIGNYLMTKGAEKAAEAALEKAGESASEGAIALGGRVIERLRGAIGQRGEGATGTALALRGVEGDPKSEDWRRMLVTELEGLGDRDEAFAKLVMELSQEVAGGQGDTIRAGRDVMKGEVHSHDQSKIGTAIGTISGGTVNIGKGGD